MKNVPVKEVGLCSLIELMEDSGDFTSDTIRLLIKDKKTKFTSLVLQFATERQKYNWTQHFNEIIELNLEKENKLFSKPNSLIQILPDLDSGLSDFISTNSELGNIGKGT